MARYKDYNYEQGKMIPISFREQILPGTFEYTLSHLIDHELDLSIFAQRYNNADSGFHTERNAEYLYTNHIDGYIADNRMRQRDPRFQDVDKYKARSREETRQWQGHADRFTNTNFATTRTPHLPLPGGEIALQQRQQHHHQRLYRGQIHRAEIGVPPARAMPEVPRPHRGAPGVFLQRRYP